MSTPWELPLVEYLMFFPSTYIFHSAGTPAIFIVNVQVTIFQLLNIPIIVVLTFSLSFNGSLLFS